jgi:type I restriction enzyme S subunit
MSRYWLQPNDVLFNNTNSAELVGKSSLFYGYQEEVVFSNHFSRLRPVDTVLEAGFLARWLQSKWEDGTFNQICNRWVGQAAVTKSMLLDLYLPLPPLQEQMRIATILNEQMAAEERLEAAQALSAAFLKEMFEGVVPISVKPVVTDAPQGWEWKLFTEVARLESGHTPSRRHPEYWENGDIPWLALPDIRAVDGRYCDITGEYTNEIGIRNSSARILPAGTVALSRTASVGFATIFSRPMATSQDFVNWVCTTNISPEFLLLALVSSRDYIRNLSSGATHKTVYVPTVKSFRVCMPSIDAQERLSSDYLSRRNSLDLLTTEIERDTQTIEAIPAALLRKAFSGEL